ncbi:DUF1972 domain-containing protein [Parapedobacter sp. 2B3]|uniref:DUF1972 domain-containing protein n=1 Tax=Parapedobacter sp. 2B3 TaxID=3342381 RepID=UPI0035B6A244
MSKRKTIAIVGTNGLPGRYGGWDQLMNHLTDHLRDSYQFIVYTSSYNAVKGLREYNGAKLKILPLKANGWQSVPYDSFSLIHALFNYDLVLVLGPSGCLTFPILKLFKQKIIFHPDGAEWKRDKWSKNVRRFLKFLEGVGIKNADAIIADNKVIQHYVHTEYGRSSDLIEYGGDNVKSVPLSPETARLYNIEPREYAFKVCRIEPENNIAMILEAFSKTSIKLILIGNWNFSEFGKEIRKKYSGYENLILLDPIYEQKRLDELRGNCKIYVHGHSVGGTNPSLVEAMSLGLFCAVFKVDYNIETTENSAMYFGSADELMGILNDVNTIDMDFYRQRMKSIAERRYRWKIITTLYSGVFKRLL